MCSGPPSALSSRVVRRTADGWRAPPPFPPQPAQDRRLRSGLAEDAVHLRPASRTGALGHPATGVTRHDLALEVALLLALDAVAVVGVGHGASLSTRVRCVTGESASGSSYDALCARPLPGWICLVMPASRRWFLGEIAVFDQMRCTRYPRYMRIRRHDAMRVSGRGVRLQPQVSRVDSRIRVVAAGAQTRPPTSSGSTRLPLASGS